jgi:hypothetical protein
LTPSDIRDPKISQWIAARMAELHSVDITDIDNISLGESNTHGSNELCAHTGFEIARNVTSWLGPAQNVLSLPGVGERVRHELDLPKFRYEWEKYLAWALARPKTFGTRRVFAHNDAQYGNLLRLKDGSEGVDEHRQVKRLLYSLKTPTDMNLFFSSIQNLMSFNPQKSFNSFPRSSLLILNIPQPIQQLTTLPITSTSGQPTTTVHRLTSFRLPNIPHTSNDVTFIALTSGMRLCSLTILVATIMTVLVMV